MSGGDAFLTTHPSGEWGVRPLLAALGDEPFAAAVVQVLPRGAESGRSEARGAAVERVWNDVLSRVPGVSGVRASWDMLLFLVPATRGAELDGALEMALLHASTPDVELFCAAADVTGATDEKLRMLDRELMEEFGARWNFGTRTSVRGRRVDGVRWP